MASTTSGDVQTVAFEDRPGVLEAQRVRKMAKSAHAYVRGATSQFYEWLAALEPDLPRGPSVWICGDCHLGNLGPLADADGKVDVQIRDLDQTVIGNPAHDLIRLGLSLASAARSSDLPGVTTSLMLEEMVAGYRAALRAPEEDGLVPEPGVIATVRRQALGRRWGALARERLQDVRPTIPLGRRFWAPTDTERTELKSLFSEEAVRAHVLAMLGRERGEIELVDVAYWMKGCSSLGKRRYAVLLALGGKRRARYALIDLKEAAPSVAPAATDAEMPSDSGARVVAGARALAPNLGERMLAVRLGATPMVLRELMPQDLKLEVDQFSRSEAVEAARYLAYVVGRAHARQMDSEARTAWRDTLARDHHGALDAPSWLWSSVAELAARHELGYLDHCRRFALPIAA